MSVLRTGIAGLTIASHFTAAGVTRSRRCGSDGWAAGPERELELRPRRDLRGRRRRRADPLQVDQRRSLTLLERRVEHGPHTPAFRRERIGHAEVRTSPRA